jgi:hypothetical protein
MKPTVQKQLIDMPHGYCIKFDHKVPLVCCTLTWLEEEEEEAPERLNYIWYKSETCKTVHK